MNAVSVFLVPQGSREERSARHIIPLQGSTVKHTEWPKDKHDASTVYGCVKSRRVHSNYTHSIPPFSYGFRADVSCTYQEDEQNPVCCLKERIPVLDGKLSAAKERSNCQVMTARGGQHSRADLSEWELPPNAPALS